MNFRNLNEFKIKICFHGFSDLDVPNSEREGLLRLRIFLWCNGILKVNESQISLLIYLTYSSSNFPRLSKAPGSIDSRLLSLNFL